MTAAGAQGTMHVLTNRRIEKVPIVKIQITPANTRWAGPIAALETFLLLLLVAGLAGMTLGIGEFIIALLIAAVVGGVVQARRLR